MRKLFVIPLLAMAAVAFASVPATASAAACQEQFGALEADTQSVAITSGKVDKERAGLLKLVADAEALTAAGKTADAVTKLRDYEVKVGQLETAGRISAESAAQLRADAEAAIACLQPAGA